VKDSSRSSAAEIPAFPAGALDIGGLIATGAKDENGLVLPAVVAAGVAQWFTPGNGTGTGRLLVSLPKQRDGARLRLPHGGVAVRNLVPVEQQRDDSGGEQRDNGPFHGGHVHEFGWRLRWEL
jgi:hypothetical protein